MLARDAHESFTASAMNAILTLVTGAHADASLLRALVEALPILLLRGWAHEPTLNRLRDAREVNADAESLQALLDEVTKELNDTFPTLRLFWKDRDLRWFGCCPRFARDAGKEPPAALVGLSDDSPGISFRRQAAKYHRDDRRVMEVGYAYDICERQDRSADQVVWLQTSKVALYDAQGVCGVAGAYNEVDAATARKLLAAAF